MKFRNPQYIHGYRIDSVVPTIKYGDVKVLDPKKFKKNTTGWSPDSDEDIKKYLFLGEIVNTRGIRNQFTRNIVTDNYEPGNKWWIEKEQILGKLSS